MSKKYFAKLIPVGEIKVGHTITKLFLCSKDTWYGDPPVGRYIYSEVNGNSITATKVIGEISPDATWVKEGDEFDLSDIKPMYYTSSQGWVVGANYDKEQWDLTKSHTVFVKGPCGHFH